MICTDGKNRSLLGLLNHIELISNYEIKEV